MLIPFSNGLLWVPREMRHYQVKVELDAETCVWFVSESDVPGLHAEASSLDEMLRELEKLVPELIKLNSDDGPAEVPWELVARSQYKVQAAC